MDVMESQFESRRFDDLNDDLVDAAGNGNGNGQHARGPPRGRGLSTSSSRSGGAQPKIDEEDELDLELEALANGTDPDKALAASSATASAQTLALQQQGRLLRKAKRAARANSISEEGRFGSTHAGPGTKNCMKNSRKSRSGLGRGLPKKGETHDPD